MNVDNADLPPAERIDRLERKAKVIRSRLFRAVDALDARRHQVARAGHQAKAIVKPALISLAGAAAVFGATAIAIGFAVRARRRSSISHRLSEGITSAMRGLDFQRRPSLGRRMVERLALAAVTYAVTELTKRGAKNFLDGRLPDGRLAVGAALDVHHQRLSQPHEPTE